MSYPRLHYGLRSYVIARDKLLHKILLGGLGAMGVGQLWFDEEDRHKEYPGYKEAIELEYGQFYLP